MARILIFGGHGKVAQLTSPLLAARGDEVSAVIRNPDHAEQVRQAGVEPVLFDVEREDAPGFERLIAGHDAVVWSAGAGGGDPRRTLAVDRDAAIRAMDAAARAGVTRFVMVSYFGARTDHGVPPENSFFTYAEAKAAADEYLRSSSLDATILGPSALTAGQGTGLIETTAAESGSVSRANVALVIAETLLQPGTIGRTIRFNDGQTPVAEALRS